MRRWRRFTSSRSARFLAFLTLFTWYAALSLMYHTQAVWAVGFGLVWGFAAMLLVAVIFHYLSRLGEVGTSHIETCLGTSGTVYVDIPENGLGQVRCMVSDTVLVYQGPSAGGKAIKAGTPVQILWKVDDSTVEVEPTAT